MTTVSHQQLPVSTSILTNIFRYLPGRIVAQTTCVCHKWLEIVNQDDELWRELFEKEFGHPTTLTDIASWKSAFVCEWKWRYGKLSAETIQGYTVECIQLTPRGLIAGSVGGPVIINTSDGSCRKLVRETDNGIFAVTCFKGCDQWIVAASSLSSEVCIWDASGGNCVVTMKSSLVGVSCLDFVGSPPKTVVTGFNDGSIGVWDVGLKACVTVLKGHDYMVSCICFDGNIIVSGSCDRAIKVWPIKYGQCMETWEEHNGAVTCLALDKNTVISGSYDSTIRMWDLVSSNIIRKMNHPDEVLCLKRKGRWIVTGCADKFIRMWNADSGLCVREIEGPSAPLSLDFDGFCIVGGFLNNTVCMWSIDATASNFAPVIPAHKKSEEFLIQRMRSLPSGIPRCPLKSLHSAATDILDEESDIMNDDGTSVSSDDIYEDFSLDVAIAVGNVLKDASEEDYGSVSNGFHSTSMLSLLPVRKTGTMDHLPARGRPTANCDPHGAPSVYSEEESSDSTVFEEMGDELLEEASGIPRMPTAVVHQDRPECIKNLIEPQINTLKTVDNYSGESERNKELSEKSETEENHDRSKNVRRNPITIISILVRSLPCLIAGGAWFLFRKRSV